MDLVARAPRIPLAGQTLTGSDFTTTPGGKGANQAVAVARLGYPVHIVGAVGQYVFGEALIANLRAEGVDVSSVARVEGPSGVAPIAVTDSGENAIIVVPGANGRVTPESIDHNADLVRSAGMVLCQLELPIETVAHTVSLCAQAGVPVMLDPAPAAPLPESLFSQLAWFTPNETEAELYAPGAATPEAAAQQLLARGLHGVVLKRGSHGSLVATAGQPAATVPAFPVTAIDTVAAGDCFNGAFAVALLEGLDPLAAARFASAAAAISVTRHGAQASMPTRAEVDALLRAPASA